MENLAANTNDNSTPQLKIVISCNKATTGTVKNYITGVTMSFSIGTGGGIDTVLVRVNDGYVKGSEASSSNSMGLIIQANDTITVSAQNTKSYSCDAALIYPIEALGVDYRVFSNNGDASNAFATGNYKSSFAIVATENNTSIDITPSCATTGGKSANVTYTITLQKGQTYQVMASTNKLDLSGTLVQAKDCKKIAVFGGSTRSAIFYGSCAASYDHLYEQMMPMNLWGKKFICIPTIYKKGTQRRADLIRIIASASSTTVRCNGKLKILAAGVPDTFYITGNSIITASKPVGVCQYAISEDCDKLGGFNTSDADPMMMWVAPIEQSLKNLSFVCENALTINKFFLNVIVKTAYRNTFRLDGSAPGVAWKLVTKDTSYSYIQQDGLAQGKHAIYSPYGFSAVLYAYGDHGSYGFNAGSSVKPLSFFSVVNNKSSADMESDSLFFPVCQGASIPFDAGGSNTTGVSWKWLVHDKSGLTVKTSKSFTKIFLDTGNFIIEMIAQRPANGVCNGMTTIDDTITTEVRVYKKPFLRLMNDTTICRGNSVAIRSSTDGDTNYTFTPSTWLNCSKCFEPVSKPLKDTAYQVVSVFKGCTPNRDTVRIRIRDSIFLATSADTSICRGTTASLRSSAKGGLAQGMTVTWDHMLGTGLSKSVMPKTTTVYRAILTDGCTRDDSGNLYADTNFIKVTVFDSLKISLSPDTLVCRGTALTILANITGGRPGTSVVTWNHNLGNGLSKLVNADSGITYKAVLSDGCTVPKDSGYMRIDVRPGIRFDTTLFQNPVCKNQLVKISSRTGGGDSSGFKFKLYNQTLGNLLVDSSEYTANPEFTAQVADDSKFYIVMKQACNTQQAKYTFGINIKTGLSINNTIPEDTICSGQTYTLKTDAISLDMQPVKFVLKIKNGLSYQAIDSMTHATTGSFVLSPANSRVDYMVTGDDQCSRNDTSYFTLFVRNPLSLVKLQDNDICRNTPLTYQAFPAGGKVSDYAYRWYDILTNMTLDTMQAMTFTPSQTMDIGLEVSDGCSAPVSSRALIRLAPIVTDSSMATRLMGCEPFDTRFIYPATQGIAPVNTPFTWTWTFDGGNPIVTNANGGDLLPDISKSYPAAGKHTARVQMKLSNGRICFDKDTIIEAWKQAKADFIYAPEQVDIIDPEVTFTNQSTGATQYQWIFSDGSTDNTSSPLHLFADTGTYSITLIASNIHNCNDTFTDQLRVLDIFRIFIPEAFSPNTDLHNATWAPQMTSTLTCELSIFNRWGEKIVHTTNNTGSWDGTYQGVDCESGVYYYHLKIRDNRMKWHYYNGMISLIR